MKRLALLLTVCVILTGCSMPFQSQTPKQDKPSATPTKTYNPEDVDAEGLCDECDKIFIKYCKENIEKEKDVQKFLSEGLKYFEENFSDMDSVDITDADKNDSGEYYFGVLFKSGFVYTYFPYQESE